MLNYLGQFDFTGMLSCFIVFSSVPSPFSIRPCCLRMNNFKYTESAGEGQGSLIALFPFSC